uniref:Uncharacterized protein n=1 Tax=Maylandia zebra TaxID=106582 RepID=A0A3P9CYL9_9CICH
MERNPTAAPKPINQPDPSNEPHARSHRVVLRVADGAGQCGQCDSVFKGFSDCLISWETTWNLHQICTYWDNFHSCATTALADCQEGICQRQGPRLGPNTLPTILTWLAF